MDRVHCMLLSLCMYVCVYVRARVAHGQGRSGTLRRNQSERRLLIIGSACSCVGARARRPGRGPQAGHGQGHDRRTVYISNGITL